MASKQIRLSLDQRLFERLLDASRGLQRPPQWLLKQALVDALEQPFDVPTRPDGGDVAEHEPFTALADAIQPETPWRAAITSATRPPEPEVVQALLSDARLDEVLEQDTRALALELCRNLRHKAQNAGHAGLVQSLLQEYSLSSQEGIALMCLAEALLRIPDAATRDALIRDKIGAGDWQAHLGHSRSLFVNAATWGLILTGRLAGSEPQPGFAAALTRAIGKGSEAMIRHAVDLAMRLLGEQFVAGKTIEQALGRARSREEKGFRHSYDMLGEAALTAADAERYRLAYEQAIHAIGAAAGARGIYAGPGISIKLSALHPRYTRSQRERVMHELYPVLRGLVALARRYDIGLNIDAEEAERLELSLELLERLCFEPELAGWNGIGFVVQAYQKRCPALLDYLIELARRSQRRLMVRLVKGAYWDSEIKRAQLDGLEDYPVYTRKAHTDLAYLASARKLLAAPEQIFPQFATHNARTLAAIYQLAGDDFHPGQYEFQCLHGMGEPLYEQVVGRQQLNRPCRIYAPVGSHETLLAYLVRRLLENGANSSFVNRIADDATPLEALVADPLEQVLNTAAIEGEIGRPNPSIPLPAALLQPLRRNSRGLDLANEHSLGELACALLASLDERWEARPLLGEPRERLGPLEAIVNPANPAEIVGHVENARLEDIDTAYRWALESVPGWQVLPPKRRGERLERAAELFEQHRASLIALLVREAGKSYANAVGEVREACDFLRYYAALLADFDNTSHPPLGPLLCISPWNFPLAIFTGQIAAALAAGNAVLAKPAEQTPLVAARAVALLHEAGVPRAALQLLPGPGETLGAALAADPRLRGLMFTGSTEVARALQESLAANLGEMPAPPVLIAETGGLNAMIVDSSALPEQVVQDVLVSAFDSAGQRCSALRILCLQEEIAERTLEMLKGAMAELRVGDPQRLDTDLGPLIDEPARQSVSRHLQAMATAGYPVFQAGRSEPAELEAGTFLLPTLIELDSLDAIDREVFGPVLHVLRYRAGELAALVEAINAKGYGLTMGLHSRIDHCHEQVAARARVGNLYLNRNMVGAVVGVQPFGGEGLSGTGPKAGGPLYLYRLLADFPSQALSRTLERIGESQPPQPETDPALAALQDWATEQPGALAELCREFDSRAKELCTTRLLPGPTGERNLYRLLPREAVLCLAESEADLLAQLAAVLAVGSTALCAEDFAALIQRLPEAVRERLCLTADWAGATGYSCVLHHGSEASLTELAQRLAGRDGPLVSIQHRPSGSRDIALQALLVERSISLNTAAAGGNASLLSAG